MKISSVYVDRLNKSLSRAGVTLKRAQLLEILAASLGFHNSNEFTAAAQRGDLTPPSVVPLGKVSLPDGQTVILVNDTLANAPYGIDEAFVEQIVEEERAEKIGVTPYGHLALLDKLAVQPIPELKLTRNVVDAHNPLDTSNVVAIGRNTLELLISAAQKQVQVLRPTLVEGIYDGRASVENIAMAIGTAQARLNTPVKDSIQLHTASTEISTLRLHCASISHKHGTNAYTQLSRKALFEDLANYCVEYWDEVSWNADLPSHPEGMDNKEIVDAYFQVHETEFLDLSEPLLEISEELLEELRTFTALPEAKQPTAPAEAEPTTHMPPPPAPVSLIASPSDILLNEVADCLERGERADIWYDAETFEDNEDSEAAETIQQTQTAMLEAAKILRQFVSAPPVPTNSQLGATQPVWLTDALGDVLHDSGANEAMFQQIGLSYRVEDGIFFPLSANEEAALGGLIVLVSKYISGRTLSAGMTALYQGKKFHSFSIAYNSENEAEITALYYSIITSISALGGHILFDRNVKNYFDQKIQILLPLYIAESAGSPKDYFNAIDYLVNGTHNNNAASVSATFRPQIWECDHAIKVDPMGPAEFDITFELLLMGSDQAQLLDVGDELRDDLRNALCSAPWIKDWPGPFEVDIQQANIDALFKIIR